MHYSAASPDTGGRQRALRARTAGRTSRPLLLFTGLLVTLLVTASPAGAYWRSSGAGNGSATTGTLAPPTGVTVPVNGSSGVPVSWTASTGSPTPTGYYVTRTSGGTTVAACGSSASSLVAGTSCTDAGVPVGTYTYVVTAAYRSWTAASTPSGSVTVASATKVVFTEQPSSAVAVVAITPSIAVTVQTAVGAPVLVAGTSVTLAIGTSPGGGTLSGTLTALTNSSGVATFAGLSINKAGVGYTLIATSSGLTSATSAAFTITASAAAKFVITSAPVSGLASASANLGPITVQEQDAFGNAVATPGGGTAVTLSSNSAGTRVFSLSSGGAAITTVTIPAASSSVNFYYGDTKAATPTITASGSLTSATQTETVTAAAAAQLAFGQQPTNTAKGATIAPPITVLIRDQFGNQTASTASVAIAIGTNAGLLNLGILSGTTLKAAVAGVVTFNNLSIDGPLGVGGAGTGYTLQVTSAGLTSAISNPFNIA